MSGVEYVANTLRNGNTIPNRDIIKIATFFFVSPITKRVEYRRGYFEEYMEARIYLDNLKSAYDVMNSKGGDLIPYVSFISGEEISYFNKLDLYKVEWEK